MVITSGFWHISRLGSKSHLRLIWRRHHSRVNSRPMDRKFKNGEFKLDEGISPKRDCDLRLIVLEGYNAWKKLEVQQEVLHCLVEQFSRRRPTDMVKPYCFTYKLSNPQCKNSEVSAILSKPCATRFLSFQLSGKSNEGLYFWQRWDEKWK